MPKTRTRKTWGGFFPEYELRRRETGFNCNIGWEGNLKYSLYSSLHPCNSWDPIFSCHKSNGDIGVHHGGIFNLEFSPDGRQLVAACEKKAVMIFDPLTRKQIYDVAHAHSSCVNGIKFLDNRVFATCSDDKTVALWDARNLSRKIVRLHGHNNWVKNIEYCSDDGLLVTSGFDGRILGWNINSYTTDSVQCSELFSMQGLMRIRLTPDLTKLIVCTTGGYMVVVHNLSLKNLSEDLQDFKPDVYRVMQISNTPLAQHAKFTNLFHRKRNRIEFISDFPVGNDAEVIHSLQVHPQGWCVLSRNTSTGDSSEWTCVHDIQELDCKEREGAEKKDEKDTTGEEESRDKNLPSPSSPRAGGNRDEPVLGSSFCVTTPTSRAAVETLSANERRARDLRLALTIGPRVEVMLRQMPRHEDDDDDDDEDEDDDDDQEEEEEEEDNEDGHGGGRRVARDRGRRRRRRGNESEVTLRPGDFEDTGYDVQLRFTSTDVFETLEQIRMRSSEDGGPASAAEHRLEGSAGPSGVRGRPAAAAQGEPVRVSYGGDRNGSPLRQDFRLRRRRDAEDNTEGRGDYRSVFLIRSGFHSHSSILVLPPWNSYSRGVHPVDRDHKIARNNPRLTNFIEEPNKGKGFIKELCFSADGRLICSPFDCGVRLMMFDEKCSELSHCVQNTPQPLWAISNNICHTNCVVSTKFSPVDCLLVSGCLNGKIVWHQPII